MDEVRDLCVQVFQAAVNAAQPYHHVRNTLHLSDGCISVGTRIYNVNQNVHLAAFGKAALDMVHGAEDALDGHIIEGIASVPRNTLGRTKEINFRTKFLEGATNNLPDEDACNNARMIEEMAERLQTPNDIFLVLISGNNLGGGSALLSAPASCISLDDKRKTINEMTSRGANIKQLNTVRKALSRLKGGKLAQKAHPAKIVALIVADIVGDPLEFIASGPTVISASGKLDPIAVLRELNAWDVIPSAVQNALHKYHEIKSDIDVHNTVILNNVTALLGASEVLKKNGYRCHLVSSVVTGDADLYGCQLAQVISSALAGKSFKQALESAKIESANNAVPPGDKIALLFGGECTVTIKGNGEGGRNQQIVLATLSKLLEKFEIKHRKVEFGLMSAGTDGQDGPTDAAGAILTSDDMRYIYEMGSLWKKTVIDSYLNNNNSYNFWKIFNNGKSHIICGPTGTNVMDIQVLLLIKKKEF
uniref:Glycerate kinase n=1 Tax=Setaria digitata TaxID=48799 RepID=A0A915PF37_9BILA